MNSIRLAAAWLRYQINANSRHGVHSPFVYSLVENILYKDKTLPVHRQIESIRKKLLKDPAAVSLTDYGAGSRTGQKTTVKDVVKSAATSPRYGRLLSRLASGFGVQTILELGTSAGIGTMYLAAGNPGSQVVTLEGDPVMASIAAANFRAAGLNNITIVTGRFSDTLPAVLEKYGRIDLLYIDGDHRSKALEACFLECLTYFHNDSLIIVDDIRWSDDMLKGWNTIREHPAVTVSVDLFFKGLIFLRKEQPRQKFTIRF